MSQQCQACHSPINASSQFCVHCGAPVASPTGSAPGADITGESYDPSAAPQFDGLPPPPPPSGAPFAPPVPGLPFAPPSADVWTTSPDAWSASSQLGYPAQRPATKRAPFVVVVVVLLLAIAGVSWVLVSRNTADSTAGPSTSSASSGTPSGGTASSGSASSGGASGSYQYTQAAPAPASNTMVQLAAGVSSSQSDAILSLLQRHFDAINNSDYSAYAATQVRPASQADFSSGYSSTRDTDMQITSIEPTGADSAAVGVSFTSTQDPSDAPAGMRVGRICWQVRWNVVNVSSQPKLSGSAGKPGMEAC